MSWPTELASEFAQRLTALVGARALSLPEDLEVREGALGDTPATMHSRAWTLPRVPWFRLAILDAGERARVLSALALPDPAHVLPMFGAEIVEIRGRITVVAIDWMPVGADSIDEVALREIRRSFDDFPPGGDLPEWAADAFSPHALYSRPGAHIDSLQVRPALHAYLEGYLRQATAAPTRDPASDSALAASRYIRHYCREHFENDPGGRMLDGIFGKAWVERYAREFLFRQSTTTS